MDDCWETYTNIFEHDATKYKYPSIIIWDLLESFVYQFSQYYTRVATIDKKKLSDEHFNVKKTIEILKKLQKDIPSNVDKKSSLSSQETFAIYSLVIHAIIEVYYGNYKTALDILGQINYNHLLTFSRAFGSQLTLFLTITYCYFMIGEYNKGGRLCEFVIFYYLKYKKFLAKMMDKYLVRQFERIVSLLSIFYVFLEESPKSNMVDLFKNSTIKSKDKQQYK